MDSKQPKGRISRKRKCLIAGLLLLSIGIFLTVYSEVTKPRFGVISENVLTTVAVDEIPEGALYITGDRRTYKRGSMLLTIPAIEVNTQIGESTLPEGLKEMPGLYEFSQLPGPDDVNVSIAGHRDIYGMEFYSLDQLKEGDFLYLIYNDTIFRYMYEDTRIVHPNEWDVIKRQGFSCLTLTTCDPIGTTLNRLIVRARLAGVEPYDEEYEFI